MRRLDLDESNIGVKIGGRTINNLRYADDTTLLAENAEDLNVLISKLKTEGKKMGLSMNVKKTKVMITATDERAHITIDNEEIEVVDSFIFLGSPGCLQRRFDPRDQASYSTWTRRDDKHGPDMEVQRCCNRYQAQTRYGHRATHSDLCVRDLDHDKGRPKKNRHVRALVLEETPEQ